MGYYLNPLPVKGKAQALVESHGATKQYDLVIVYPPQDLALVCVVDNGRFEAAALITSGKEFLEFSNPFDERPKTWLLMDREIAYRMAGFGGR